MGGRQGLPVMASRMAVMTSRPCLRTVEMKPRTRSQFLAPVAERWQPEILSWVLTGRRSRSLPLLVNGTARSVVKSRIWSSRSRMRCSRFRVLVCLRPSLGRCWARPTSTACRYRSSGSAARSAGIAVRPWSWAVLAGGPVRPARCGPGRASAGRGGPARRGGQLTDQMGIA